MKTKKQVKKNTKVKPTTTAPSSEVVVSYEYSNHEAHFRVRDLSSGEISNHSAITLEDVHFEATNNETYHYEYGLRCSVAAVGKLSTQNPSEESFREFYVSVLGAFDNENHSTVAHCKLVKLQTFGSKLQYLP